MGRYYKIAILLLAVCACISWEMDSSAGTLGTTDATLQSSNLRFSAGQAFSAWGTGSSGMKVYAFVGPTLKDLSRKDLAVYKTVIRTFGVAVFAKKYVWNKPPVVKWRRAAFWKGFLFSSSSNSFFYDQSEFTSSSNYGGGVFLEVFKEEWQGLCAYRMPSCLPVHQNRVADLCFVFLSIGTKR
ncbi:hypothetical protein FVE67_08560 [Thermosulfurimonas marina]|uniref:Uncharacterized protein n=1 Tax=Thermosulfurimonas marina TaxID=2047767 RepID=A0A6H1WUQ4_9BACT|nr:hypothetical protein [Thermosulfurimonas marina]QJA06836.1 hypothetical protein FVE67_08560 [Thermosulfurimonas marina]